MTVQTEISWRGKAGVAGVFGVGGASLPIENIKDFFPLLRTSSDQAWSYAPKLQRARSSLGSERAMEGWIHRSPTPPENDTTREERWKKRNWQQGKDWRKRPNWHHLSQCIPYLHCSELPSRNVFYFPTFWTFPDKRMLFLSMLLPLTIADRHLTCDEIFITRNKEIGWALPC